MENEKDNRKRLEKISVQLFRTSLGGEKSIKVSTNVQDATQEVFFMKS